MATVDDKKVQINTKDAEGNSVTLHFTIHPFGVMAGFNFLAKVAKSMNATKSIFDNIGLYVDDLLQVIDYTGLDGKDVVLKELNVQKIAPVITNPVIPFQLAIMALKHQVPFLTECEDFRPFGEMLEKVTRTQNLD